MINKSLDIAEVFSLLMETFSVSVDSLPALIFQLLFNVSAADCSVLVILSGRAVNGQNRGSSSDDG